MNINLHQEDKISISLAFLTAGFIIYLSTFLGNPPNLDLPITLLGIGLSLQLFLKGRIQRDDTMSSKEIVDITQSTLLAVGGMFFASFTIPKVFTPASIVPLSTMDEIIYGQIFAVSEEIFFRGAITSFIMWIFPTGFHIGFMGYRVPAKIFVSICSGGVFAFYHLAVYGISQATFYVLIAGILLAAVTLYSRRISPAILSHMINNFLSVVT